MSFGRLATCWVRARGANRAFFASKRATHIFISHDRRRGGGGVTCHDALAHTTYIYTHQGCRFLINARVRARALDCVSYFRATRQKIERRCGDKNAFARSTRAQFATCNIILNRRYMWIMCSIYAMRTYTLNKYHLERERAPHTKCLLLSHPLTCGSCSDYLRATEIIWAKLNGAWMRAPGI